MTRRLLALLREALIAATLPLPFAAAQADPPDATNDGAPCACHWCTPTPPGVAGARETMRRQALTDTHMRMWTLEWERTP